MTLAESLETTAQTLWVTDGAEPLGPAKPVAWAAVPPNGDFIDIVVDTCGYDAERFVSTVTSLRRRLAAGGRLAVLHAPASTLTVALPRLFQSGVRLRIGRANENHHYYWLHQDDAPPVETGTEALTAYLFDLLRGATLPIPTHRGAPPVTMATLNIATEAPLFRWFNNRLLGLAHIVARIGNANGIRKRLLTGAVLTYKSFKRPIGLLRKFVVREKRARLPAAISPEALAARDSLVAQGAALPTSQGSRWQRKLPLRIGVVSDDILYNAIADVADVFLVTPENYQSAQMDLFLFVAAWNGMGKWPGVGQYQSASRRTLLRAIDHLGAKGVPTVFWSIEDPPHYDDFINVAQRCAYVYTTTREKVAAYQRDCATTTVDVMSFGINPLLHNPVGSRRARRSELFFAGAWYSQYPDRCVDMANVLDGAVATGAMPVIIDRCYQRGNGGFDFPEAYKPYTLPPMEHRPLQQVQKLFRWCLNFNSVRHSATMFANRVPELLAQGVGVLSNYSLSLDQMYPNVQTVAAAAEVGPLLDAGDDAATAQLADDGLRMVMADQTYVDKIGSVAARAGLAVVTEPAHILLITRGDLAHAQAALAQQTVRARVTIVAAAEYREELHMRADFVTLWDQAPDDPFYLEDQLHAFTYTDAQFVTWADDGHEFVASPPPLVGTLICARAVSFAEVSAGNVTRLSHGYALPLRAQPASRGDRLASARCTIATAQRNQGLRAWHKWWRPLDGAARLLVFDADSDDRTAHAYLRRLVTAGASVEHLSASTNATTDVALGLAHAWRHASIETEYVVFAPIDWHVNFGGGADLIAALQGNAEVIVTTVHNQFPSPRRSRADAQPRHHLMSGMAAARGLTQPPPLGALLLRREIWQDARGYDPHDPTLPMRIVTSATQVCVSEARLFSRYQA